MGLAGFGHLRSRADVEEQAWGDALGIFMTEKGQETVREALGMMDAWAERAAIDRVAKDPGSGAKAMPARL